MQNGNKTRKNLMVAGAVLLFLFLVYFALFRGDGGIEFTVLYTNDLRGNTFPYSDGSDKTLRYGLARQANAIKEIKEENIKKGVYTLVFSAGNNFQGTEYSAIFRGLDVVDTFNACGYNAIVPGSHDLDYGAANLISLAQKAKFKFLAANLVLAKDSRPVFDTSTVLEASGRKIAVFGLVTQDLAFVGHDNVSGLKFTDPLAAAKKIVPQLRKNADVVILLSSLGTDVDRELAKKVDGIDIIIGEIGRKEPRLLFKEGRTTVCRTAGLGTELGILDIKVAKKKLTYLKGDLLRLGDNIKNDEDVKVILDNYTKQLKAGNRRIVGRSSVMLDIATEKNGRTESVYGDHLTDLMRKKGLAHAAFLDNGAFAGPLPKGNITIGDILASVQAGQTMVVFEMMGENIERIIKKMIEKRPGSPDALQISGLKIVIENGRLSGIKIAGQPLRPKVIYRIAATRDLAKGNRGYNEFKDGRNYADTGILLSELVLLNLERKGSIGAPAGGRIVKKEKKKEGEK